MGLMDHLEELRQRIVVSAVAILLATAVAFIFADKILHLLLLPSGGLSLNAFGIMDGFMIKWKIALYAGITVAFPVWAYEIYKFVAPGMMENEKKAVFPILGGSMVLFAAGSGFGYYLLWGMIRVLIQFFPVDIKFLPSADDYISFVVFFLLACGLAFQLPTLILIFVQLRILNVNLLQKQRRIAYFALFAFAELVTPVADPIIAPLTVMGPLIILYEISILIAKRIEAGRKPEELETAAPTPPDTPA